MTDKPPKASTRASRHRLDRLRSQAQKPLRADVQEPATPPARNVSVDCGWGRLHFAQTFESPAKLVQALREERPDQRDIAFYVRDPHVVVASAPQDLFLDPSHTYRLDLATWRGVQKRQRGFAVRRLCTLADAEEVNRIYGARHMVEVDPQWFWSRRDSRTITVFVAEDLETDAILGAVTGVDHRRAFNDTEGGSSLWCLAVDPQAAQPGVGQALVTQLAAHFQTRGAQYMDLSVLHDNDQAIALYEKLGFFRVPVFAIKNRNTINEPLFSGRPPDDEELNVYARIIVEEARRRGISVEILDAENGYFRLTYGGRSIVCRESLSELTTAIAMSRCDDKIITRRVLTGTGLSMPEQQLSTGDDADAAFLERHGSIVVKPARGEQGRGVFVDVKTLEEVRAAVAEAKRFDDRVVLEQFVEGDDLRVIVIDYRVVAAATRRPPRIVGDGQRTIRELIEHQSRRREAATHGESSIPIDAETARCLQADGLTLADVPKAGDILTVRKTANLHTGGTIHDVTDELHPALVDASVRAARALSIPVVGLDFIVEAPTRPEYWIIEANERPGLANHEPQPTAQRFVDLLFPQSIPTFVRRYAERQT